MKNTLKKLSLLTTIFALSPISAQASFVAPKRVMIENRQDAKSITLFNRKNEPVIYAFEWEDRAQAKDGQVMKLFDGVTKEGETIPEYKSAKDMLIFSPRQIVVQPNSSQKVRIFAKRPANLPDGEYHSHLLIKPDLLENKESNPDDLKGNLGGYVKIKSHISIPVFLRQGPSEINFDIKDYNFSTSPDDGSPLFTFTFDNKSTRSFYSRNILECVTSDGTSQDIVMGSTRVYVEGNIIPQSRKWPKTAPPLDSCNKLYLKIGALQDFEYGTKDFIKTIEIR